MPVLGDFIFIRTGGNFQSNTHVTDTFNTGGRYGHGGLGYVLVEIIVTATTAGATGEFRINNHLIVTMPLHAGSSVHVLRFGEDYLNSGANTFDFLAKGASGGFGNVICHFHQAT